MTFLLSRIALAELVDRLVPIANRQQSGGQDYETATRPGRK